VAVDALKAEVKAVAKMFTWVLTHLTSGVTSQLKIRSVDSKKLLNKNHKAIPSLGIPEPGDWHNSF
jgi:hypothetical protein